MRRLVVGSAFFFVLAGRALAADAVVEEATPLAEAAPVGFVWTGGYVGLQGGWQWGDDHIEQFYTDTREPTGFDEGFRPDGFVGGVHVGYNWQVDRVVFGAEADFEFTGVDGGFMLGPEGVSVDLDWQASMRGRLGYTPTERLLIYGTAGVAFADLEYTYHDNGGITESFGSTETGWTVGAGTEYAFTEKLTARLEYRYSDFGNVSNDSHVANPGFTYEHDPAFHAVRAGFSYMF